MTTATRPPDLVPADRLRQRLARRAVAPPPPATRATVDVERLAKELASAVRGEVRFEAASRSLYAQDASNYRRFPLGVVIPRSQADIVAAIEVCRRFGAPIAPRAGGTALGGQTVNEAVVLDVSKYVNRIVALDPLARHAVVEPGVICDDLLAAAAPHGLMWGPSPATHNHCCFGGMLANNCGGMRAQMNGIAVHNVEALDVVLYDGTRMHLGWMREADLAAAIRQGGRAGAVFAGLRNIRERWATQIRARYPEIPRRVSGYNLDQLLPGVDGRFNLARVLVGSEGTLATTLEATVHLIPKPRYHAVVILGFDDLFAAGDIAGSFGAYTPTAVEGMDDLLRDHMKKKKGDHALGLTLLTEGNAWLLVEVGGDTEAEACGRAEAVAKHASGARAHRIITDPKEQASLWAAREGGLGATAFVPGEPDTWPGWEDSAVPIHRLGDYLRDLRRLYDQYDMRPSLYGHFGMGLVHCRVPFRMYTAAGIRQFRSFMNDAADLVVSYGGSLSGEHGDGTARGELLVKMFGPELMEAMRELKALFDPFERMNPGKIVRPYPLDDHLRLGPSYQPAEPKTHFSFADDRGSFARATLRCVGIGLCRRHGASDTEHDVMCPSYMVTHEEKHSTRGRAHLLWEMLRGDGATRGGWRDEGVKSALDLCLACKGCKSDCPVNVDVATYKAEFLSHYYEGRLRPRHMYAFGYVDKWARLGSLVPGLANLVTQLPGVSALAKLTAGISQQAKIPAFAEETFRDRIARRGLRRRGGRRVVLWADTFNEHFFPDTLMAAVDVLEAAGCDVEVPPSGVCCGRPLYDFGLLDDARAYLERVLDVLEPQLEAGLPVVVLEPSCASVFKDELTGILPDDPRARALKERTRLLSEILTEPETRWKPPALAGRAIVQGHCHHKAAFELDAEREVLHRLGLDHEVLSAGCCGMAGSFGFAAETHEVGVACGERALLPRVRREATSTLVIADGFSCREQLAQHTERRGLHLAEAVKLALEGRALADGAPPERELVRRREAGRRASMVRASLGLGALALAVIGAMTAWRRAFR